MKKLYFVIVVLTGICLVIPQAMTAERPDFVWHIANQNPDTFIGWGTGAVKSFFSSPKIVKDDDYFTWCALKDGDSVKLIFNKGSTHSITTWFTVAQQKEDNIASVTVYVDPLKVEVIIQGLLAELNNVAGSLKSFNFVTEVTIGK